MREIGLRSNEPSAVPRGARQRRGCLDAMLVLVEAALAGVLIVMLTFVASYLLLSHQLKSDIAQVVSFQGTGLGGTPRILDRQGNLLFELAPVEKRQWLTSAEIPEHVRQATVAVEDDTFWANPGFDPAAIAAAIVSNLKRQDERPIGASTITQQLVRHIAFDYEERVTASYRRKALEVFYALILTRQRSKQDILTMYLNEIYYGNLAYGIEAAAQTYFGKAAVDLTIAEGAFLAGLPQAPLEWNPYTNFAGAKERQEMILDLMVEDGWLDAAGATREKGRQLTLAPLISQEGAGATYLDTPHFVLYVQEELARRYGPDAFQQNGWQVTTTLDLSIQRLAEAAAREHVWARAAAHNVTNAAVVVLKPGTGEILAMVGSLDYFDQTIDGQFNMALVPRQPGSSFKPITYVAAMARGWTTGDVLWDVPIVLELGAGETMEPVNYDGAFHGPVLLRDALANSYNIPPIQLIRDVGVPQVISTARQMGVDSLREPPGYYGLALTLGGGEVPLLEMARAYATLANGGRRPELTGVAQIVDSAGRTVYDRRGRGAPAANAVEPRIAYVISDILSDNEARAPAMGRYSPLRLPFPAAAKTGTSNDYRDNWTIGYTPGLVVGVWVGNTDGRPMRNSSGLSGAAPIWNRVMQSVHTEPTMKAALLVNGVLPPERFERPNGIEERQVCLPRGTGGSQCTASREDLFLIGGPQHTVARLGYRPDASAQPGAWTLTAAALPADQAQRVWEAQPVLADDTRAPRPALCVRNVAGGGATRLFLPVPPYYPDEVRARLWAQGRGYQMAPATVCPAGVVGGGGGRVATIDDSGAAPTAHGVYAISFPSPGQALMGHVPVLGTAQFDAGEIAYYKLEIGAGSRPTEWTTFGTTHATPVQDGVLEQLNADALTPGEYVIRLVLVRHDGNFANPYAVPITIPPR
jgi:penicillin-binding protein 1C